MNAERVIYSCEDLTSDEAELLAMYRELDTAQKHRIFEDIHGMDGRSEDSEAPKQQGLPN